MIKNIVISIVGDGLPPTTDDNFQIGNRVLVGGVKPGIIVFIGEVHFSPGDWAGVVLDSPTGKNDGKIGGHRYFMCEPMRGVFCRLNKLTKLPGGVASIAPMDRGSNAQLEKNDSPDRSSSSKSDTVVSFSQKENNSKPPAVVVVKPSSPAHSTSSHHSDRGMPSPMAQPPSTNHSDGDDHMIARFHFLVFFLLIMHIESVQSAWVGCSVPSVCLSVCLSVCMSVCLFVFRSITRKRMIPKCSNLVRE